MPDLVIKNLDISHLDDLIPGIGGRFMPQSGAAPAINPPIAPPLAGPTPSMRSILPPLPSAAADTSRLAPSPMVSKNAATILPPLPDDRIPRMDTVDSGAGPEPALPPIPLQVDEPPTLKVGEPGRVRRGLSVLGKIGKTAGEIAGTAFVPNLMPWIPGTPQHEYMLEREQARAQDEAARRAYEASERERNLAEAAKDRATASQPGESAEDETRNLIRRTMAGQGYNVAFDPAGKMSVTPVEGFQRPTKVGEEKLYTDPSSGKQFYGVAVPEGGIKDTGTGKIVTGAEPFIKPSPELHDAFSEWKQDPQNYEKFRSAMERINAEGGKNTGFMTMYAMYRLLQTAYSDNPALLPIVNSMFKNVMAQQGMPVPKNFDISQVPVDQPLSPATGQPIGTRMPGAPTQSTRAQAQFAARVLDEMPTVRSEVTAAVKDLGPAKGRLLIGFLLGTVGSTGDAEQDRKLSKLRTDLTFASSASARFHLNSVRAMEQFDKLVSAGKSSPDAIRGFLDGVQEWAKTAKQQELGFGERGATAQPSGGRRWQRNAAGQYRYSDDGGRTWHNQ